MQKNFAIIKYIESLEQIPIKFELIKKSPKLLNWYIEKFTPIKIEEIEKYNTKGYIITIPITKEIGTESIGAEIIENKLHLENIIEKSIIELNNLDITFLQLPKEVKNLYKPYFYTGDKNNVLCLYIMEGILKSVNYIQKNLKDIEITIMGNYDKITQTVIEQIYPHVNFLNIFLEQEEDIEKFDQLAGNIFNEVGLNVFITHNSTKILSTADVIINTTNNNKYDFFYKKTAIYFDLSNNGKTKNLVQKREDIMVIDGANYKKNQEKITQTELETYLCTNKRVYLQYINQAFSYGKYLEIIKELSNINCEISSFTRLDKTVKIRCFKDLIRKYGAK